MKRIVKTMIIVSIILVIILLVVLLRNKNKELPFEEEIIIVEKKELNLVENRSDFYTVDSCVGTYINNLNSENEEALLSLLDQSFIKNNSITKQNVIEKLDVPEYRIEFFIEKMDYEITNSIRNFLCLWSNKK